MVFQGRVDVEWCYRVGWMVEWCYRVGWMLSGVTG